MGRSGLRVISGAAAASPSELDEESFQAVCVDGFVGVDPAEDSGSVWCHNGDASSGIAAMCATTGRDRGQDTHGVQLKAAIGSRPSGRSVRAPPTGTGRQIHRRAPRGAGCNSGQTRSCRQGPTIMSDATGRP